jgi:hypothetical protein
MPLRPRLAALLSFLVPLGFVASLDAQQPAAPAAGTQAPAKTETPKAKTDPIDRIKDEALEKSQVMATLSYLTDVIGPRLTASPAMKRANEWTRDRLAGWGLENAHIEKWGQFGKSWTLKRFSIQVVEPQCIPLIAYPKAWSPGFPAAVVGELVDLDSAKTDADLEKLKGKLKGSIVLLSPPAPVLAHFEPLGTRQSDAQLLELANAGEPAAQRRRPPAQAAAPGAPGAPAAGTPPAPPAGGRFAMTPERRAQMELQRKKLKLATDEGALAILDVSNNGDGGTLFVSAATVPGAPLPGPGGDPAARRVSAYDKDAPAILPQVTVAKEHYNRLLRMIRQGETLKVAIDLAVEFQNDVETFNTVAEIPGTDLKDELVMLGGHMDSWHSGTGATDNAAGVSVAMETMRILKALDLKPRRTVRIALWSGEEQGLLGSRAYVKEHFGQTEGQANGPGGGGGMGGAGGKVIPKPGYDKFAAYFNLDNGTGKVRGVYLQGNEAVRPIFRQWLVPFREMGANTLSLSNTGGTDHLSFDGIGLPGFQFIQDEIEYDTRTHHSNQDVYDRIQADDMKQAAAIMAAFVYQAATRDEKLPRKPTPTAAPASSPTPTPPASTNAAAAAAN